MRLTCPWCGAEGTDVEPVPKRLRGPSWTPSKGEDEYAFEVRGNLRSRPVRKCLACGNGIRVTVLPPHFRKIPTDDWQRLQGLWSQYRASENARFETAFAELQGPMPSLVHETQETAERKALMDIVEAELPSDNGEFEPVSQIIAMPTAP